MLSHPPECNAGFLGDSSTRVKMKEWNMWSLIWPTVVCPYPLVALALVHRRRKRPPLRWDHPPFAQAWAGKFLFGESSSFALSQGTFLAPVIYHRLLRWNWICSRDKTPLLVSRERKPDISLFECCIRPCALRTLCSSRRLGCSPSSWLVPWRLTFYCSAVHHGSALDGKYAHFVRNYSCLQRSS